MLGAQELPAALESLEGAPFKGAVYRAVFLEYLMGLGDAQPQPLFSMGAPLSGARFTPRGAMATLYVAEEPETAFAEAHQMARVGSRSSPPLQIAIRPTVLLEAHVQLASILDMTKEAHMERMATTRRELTAKWRLRAARGEDVATWQLGRALYESGRFTGLRYESSLRRGSFCLAIFPDRLGEGDFVSVFDPAGNIKQNLGRIAPEVA